MTVISKAKGEIVARSFKQLGMWGSSRKPSEENEMIVLEILEDTMQEFDGNGIRIGYRFAEEDPYMAEDSGVSDIYIRPMAIIIAVRCAEIFQCVPPLRQFKSAYNTLLKATWADNTPKYEYGNRTPIGSGNNRFGLIPRHYYPGRHQITVENDTQLDELTTEINE